MEKVKMDFLELKQEGLSYLYGKRIFDIIASIVLLVLLLPIFILISLAILLTSGRPIFFRQIRTGKHNELFTIWKFRTMVNHVGEKTEDDYHWSGEVPDTFVFKSNGSNSKVTKLGGVLRKYSLDELPQLFNVLRGEMSLIGPRPEIPSITRCYSAYQSRRLLSKPGITGYAQINGRSDISHGRKIEHDLYYVDHCCMGMDIKIFFLTIAQVVTGKGAY